MAETLTFDAVLTRAFDRFAQDGETKSLVKDVALTIICNVPDMNRTFVLSFHHGSIEWTYGDARSTGDLLLTLGREPLRRILAGELGLLRAVLAGDLSFEGGIPSAVGFDRVLPRLREAFSDAGGHHVAEAPTGSDVVVPGFLGLGPSNVGRVRPRIMITALIDEPSRRRLSEYGDVAYESFAEKSRLLSGPKLIELLCGVDVFVTEVDQVKPTVIAVAADLKIIATCHSDPVNVDVAACTARGIPIVCTPGRDADGVAQLAVCFILMLVRHVPAAMQFLKRVTYSASAMAESFLLFQGTELAGKTVGLVGFGRIARSVRARLKPFGPRVIAYDPPMDAAFAESQGVKLVSLEYLLRESDVISLHAPVLPETQGLISRERIALMKPTVVFVNTARAALTDEMALAEALKGGRIAAAAFDVFSEEPPKPDHPLLHLDNVIVTPHIGGNTEEVIPRQSQMAVDDLIALFEGRPPRYVVNPEVLAKFRWPWRTESTASSG